MTILSTIHVRGLSSMWMLIFMIASALVMLAVFPFLLRWRRKKEGADLHDQIEKATAKILEDGKVTIPKGPHVPHKSWNVGARAGHEPLTDGSTRAPRHGGHYGSG
jgi:hypothetical protein